MGMLVLTHIGTLMFPTSYPPQWHIAGPPTLTHSVWPSLLSPDGPPFSLADSSVLKHASGSCRYEEGGSEKGRASRPCFQLFPYLFPTCNPWRDGKLKDRTKVPRKRAADPETKETAPCGVREPRAACPSGSGVLRSLHSHPNSKSWLWPLVFFPPVEEITKA